MEPAHTSAGQTRTEVPLAQTDPCAYWHQVRRLYGSSGAAIVGNILEWYDWTLYGYMEDILMQVCGVPTRSVATNGVCHGGHLGAAPPRPSPHHTTCFRSLALRLLGGAFFSRVE